MEVNCGEWEKEWEGRKGDRVHAIGTAARVFKPGKNNSANAFASRWNDALTMPVTINLRPLENFFFEKKTKCFYLIFYFLFNSVIIFNLQQYENKYNENNLTKNVLRGSIW